MSRNRLSAIASLVLVAAAGAIYAARHQAGGSQFDELHGVATWEVSLNARGTMSAKEESVATAQPPDFRRQHVYDERWESADLLHRGNKRGTGDADSVWRRRAITEQPTPYRLTYAFRVVLGTHRFTPSMRERTSRLDAAPAPETDGTLKPTARIESDHPELLNHAKWLVGEAANSIDQVRAIHQFVFGLAYQTIEGNSALTCLQAEGGDALGKSRLFVALCRGRAIPARVISGLVLNPNSQPTLHHWAEAWIRSPDGSEGHWQPSCPTYGHLGTKQLPVSYLVLRLNDDPIIRADGPVQVSYFARAIPAPDARGLTAAQAFWHNASFAAMSPNDQHLVRFLLLLPLAAVVVSLFRVVIGVPTYGMFTPALLGLIFRDLRALPWCLGIFVLTMLVGWGMRRLLDRFHLLLIPRAAALLTLIVIFLLAGLLIASHYGVKVTNYVALFPLVILTHMVERFWTVESFKVLLGTVVVVAATALALSPDAVGRWVFWHPETLLVVVAVFVLLGRYTGYRVSELYRFRDLIEFKPAPRSLPKVPAAVVQSSSTSSREEVGV
jgi:hypothetical protein